MEVEMAQGATEEEEREERFELIREQSAEVD
jgi:hypothetical protein